MDTKAGRPKMYEGRMRIATYLSVDLIEALKRRAVANKRSVNSEVTLILEEVLKNV